MVYINTHCNVLLNISPTTCYYKEAVPTLHVSDNDQTAISLDGTMLLNGTMIDNKSGTMLVNEYDHGTIKATGVFSNICRSACALIIINQD